MVGNNTPIFFVRDATSEMADRAASVFHLRLVGLPCVMDEAAADLWLVAQEADFGRVEAGLLQAG